MEKISNTSNISNICFGVLDKLAQQKKKYNRGNNMPYISSWAHMERIRLQNRFLKNRSEVNRIDYIKRRNYCVSFLRKTKSNLHRSK